MTRPLECNINQQNLNEIGGYMMCLSDLIKYLEDKKGTVSVLELLDTITATNSVIKSIVQESKESGDFTKEMTDNEAPGKSISGPDALLLDNPVFAISYTQGIIDRLNEQLGLKP